MPTKIKYNLILIIAVSFLVIFCPTPAAECDDNINPILGTIALFPYGFEPVRWYQCDGRELSISENQDLYSLIGNKYGGTRKKTFNMPNLQSSSPLPGVNYYMAVYGAMPQENYYQNGYIGEIVLLPYAINSEDFLPCDGGKYSAAENIALYALIGNDNDSDTFSTPDLTDHAPAGLQYFIRTDGIFPPYDDSYNSGQADSFLGAISLYAFSYSAAGLTPCDGSSMIIRDNQALYALLESRFGQSDPSSFSLPDMRGAAPLPSLHYSICKSGDFPPRW